MSIRQRNTTPACLGERIGLCSGARDLDRTAGGPPRPDGPCSCRRHARPVVTDEPRPDRGDLPPGDGRGDSRRPHQGHGHPVAGHPAHARAFAWRTADVAGEGDRARPDQRRQSLLRRAHRPRPDVLRARAGSTASRRWCSTTAQTSLVYANNRDEIRQVAPGLFLGLMYDRTTAPPGLSMYFALESQP